MRGHTSGHPDQIGLSKHHMKNVHNRLGIVYLVLLFLGPVPSYCFASSKGICKSSSNGITIDIAIAADFSLVELYGQEQLFNYLGALANVALDNFNDEFDLPIQLRIVETLLVSCQSCAPWTSSTNADSLLQNFEQWATNGGFNNDYHIAQLWTQRDLFDDSGMPIFGLSDGVLDCTNRAHSIVHDFSSSLLETITNLSHELGHHLGAMDDYFSGSQECNMDEVSFIMQPGPNTAFSWSDLTGNCTMNSKEAINNWLATSCFPLDPPTGCTAVNQFTLTTSEAGDSLFLSWVGTSETESYLIEVHDKDENTTKSYLTGEENYLLELLPGEFCRHWRITVKPLCQTGIAAGRSLLIRTDCAAVSGLIYREDFNQNCDGFPAGWQIDGVGSPNWSISNGAPLDGELPINGFISGCYTQCTDQPSTIAEWEFRRATLTSPVIDLTNFPFPELWFRYYLRPTSGMGTASFYVEAYNGVTWERIYLDAGGTKCVYQTGRCSRDLAIELNSFRHDEFQLRFVYENFGRQTGFVAVDILMLLGTANEFGLTRANPANMSTTPNFFAKDFATHDEIRIYPNQPTVIYRCNT